MALPDNPLLEERLDAVVAVYLKAGESDRGRLQRELLAAHPDLAQELQEFFDTQDGFRRLAQPLREAFSAQRGHAPGTIIGHYEILGEIARGGMGVVYRARSLSLGRVVALKMLRTGSLTAEADKQRFLREAAAVAELDYPNIVPIYEVGEEELPFFSMKWMPGGSLAERLADFRWPHPPGNASSSRAGATATFPALADNGTVATEAPKDSGRPEPRPALSADAQKQRVLRLLITVAGAVHHAHTRGILHRDLKPANILLDGDDSAFVSDFGLLKRFGPAAAEPHPGDTPNIFPPTEAGLIVGTPSYMAPEQASGKSGAVSVASDVYSLGAILYEVLTGRPPFRGETAWDTLQQLIRDEPTPVRSLNPWATRDLATICHKCLHKDSAQRYASAADLAADLERHARGEPILARPVSAGERFWRWCRRNPALSAVSAAAVLFLVLVAVGGVIFGLREASHAADMEALVLQKDKALDAADKERQKKEAALVAAQDARQKAEDNRLKALAETVKADDSFRDAHKAVYDFCLSVSTELSSRPDLLPLRKKLLDSSLNYYKKFLAQRGDDPKLEHELADAFSQVGRINDLLGSKTDALPAFVKALAMFERICQSPDAGPDVKRKLLLTQMNVGVVQHALGKHQEAIDCYDTAMKLSQQFAEEYPGDKRFPSPTSITQNLAALYRDLGKLDKAIDLFKEAIVVRRQQLADDPKNIQIKGSLALSLNNLGVIQSSVGKTKDALKSFEEAFELRQQLVKHDPKNSLWKVALAASYRDIGMAQIHLGKSADGVKNLEKALALREQMAGEHNAIAYYQRDLAGSYQDFGSLYRDNKQPAKAISYYRKARDIWDKMLVLDPGVPTYQNARARCDYFLAVLHGKLGESAKEADHYEQARVVQAKLVAAYPQQVDFQSDYAATLHGCAEMWQRGGDAKAAKDALRLAIQHQKIAFAKAPGVGNYRALLNNHHVALAKLLRDEGGAAEAMQHTLARRALWTKDAKFLYGVAHELAQAARKLDDAKLREQHAVLVAETLQMAIAAGFADRKKLLSDPLFRTLQDRDDFQAVLAKLPP